MAAILSVILNKGVTRPHIGLGVLFQPNDQTVKSVSAAFEADYRLIDTTSKYENEEGVGEAVRNSGLPHEEVFVTSKLWNSDHGYDNAIIGFERSLNKLGLEYVDSYLMHWPVPSKGLTIEMWKGLERVYKEGRVKAIGVSNFLPKHLERLLQEAEIVPAVLQIEVLPTFTKENCDIFDFALSQDEVAAFSALDKEVRLAPDTDTMARE
jgi:2,5-diketo-D-gluconate reductase A